MSKQLLIGCDASRFHEKERTGIEEYAYQLLSRLPRLAPEHTFRYYAWEKTDYNTPENVEWVHLPKKQFWTQRILGKELQQHPPDIFFSPVYTLPLHHPKASVVTIHGLEFRTTPESYSHWHRIYHELITRYSLKKAAGIITVSNATKNDLERFYQIQPAIVRVIPNGIEHHDVQWSPAQPPSIVFVSRLEKRKNVAGILRAYEIVRTTYPDLKPKLLLLGKWGEVGVEEIKNLIEHSKYRENIETPGYVSNDLRIEALQHASVFVFPSLYEGFGIPVLEAMDIGVPVITSKSGSLKEVAGDAALFVDPQKPEEIANAIVHVLKNPEVGKKYSEKGKQHAQAYSWETSAQMTFQMLKETYDNVLNQGS